MCSPHYLVNQMIAKDFLDLALSGKRANGRQLLVQVGQCGVAVGATEKYSLLRESLPENVDIGVAGCDGACFATPKYHSDESYKEYVEGMDIFWTLDPKVAGFVDSQTRIAMSHAGRIGVEDIYGYIRNEGFLGLANSLTQPPKYTVDVVDESGLRGRGGAYFPVSLKWRSALAVDSSERHLVVNAEEGEPGVFKDRHIMESVPFRLIEGTLIAAYATSSTSVRIYVNAEAHLAFERIKRALDICRMSGFLGSNIMGTEFSIDIQLLKGAGGYVCGEESTLLNTIEGKRREPRLRPPFPTESGLNQKPTIINNVENMRIKECNRIQALEQELQKVGAKINTWKEGLSIEGQPISNYKGALLETYDDHRMAMCFSLLGLKIPGISIKDPQCVNKTFPEFFDFFIPLIKK